MHVINVRIKHNIILILFKYIIGRFKNCVRIKLRKKTEIHKTSLNLSERHHKIEMKKKYWRYRAAGS